MGSEMCIRDRHKIELQVYGPKGYACHNELTRGWETELRCPGAEQDFVMAYFETMFWRLLIFLSFSVALVKTLTETGLAEFQLHSIPISSFRIDLLLDLFRSGR